MDNLEELKNKAFLAPMIEILEKMTGVQAKIMETTIHNSLFPSNEIAIVIGITGDWRGAFVISASKDVGAELASKFVGGLDYSQLGIYDIAETIAEFANIVAGNAITIMEKRNENVNISPPTIVIGQGDELRIGGFSDMLITRFNSDLGEIVICLSVQKI